MQAQKIAIIGSGPAGLAAAAYLTRDGQDVTLFERFAAPRPIGAGLLLQPTGLACLGVLGLDGAAIETGAKISNLLGRTASGRNIIELSYRDLAPHLFGVGIHRGALFNILYGEAQRQRIEIVTEAEIVDTALVADKRTITAKNGRQYGPFDLVVDASGMRSGLRSKYARIKLDKPYPYGAVWGVCADPGQAFGQDYLRQRFDGAKIMIGLLAIGRRPQDNEKSLTFFWSLPAHSYAQWREDGIDAWKAKVHHYWPEIQPFVDQFKTVDDLTFAQYNDVIVKPWHGDRIVFIGDAAHSTSPQLGQGANLGLVDSMMLALSLRDNNGVNAALDAYTRARHSHTYFYQLASRALTPFFQSDSSCAAWLRDNTFGLMGRVPFTKTHMLRTFAGVKTGPLTHLNPGKWHPGYDVRKNHPPEALARLPA
ncbi:MAG: NAD(P)/FAD-dependent oxidoreductase [Micavibrio sp.]|nr:NAD(P)/FAD-dependent oxidoreductase [Micavibrio sp.]